MSLIFDFTNNPSDESPEIVLKTSGASAAEKILLFNISQGYYGIPTIIQEESKIDNGMATQIKIGFTKPLPPVEPSDTEQPVG